jgi:predicted HNH restriction endonuclease
LADLAVVCANCHVMVHLGGGSRALETLIPGRSQVPPRRCS